MWVSNLKVTVSSGTVVADTQSHTWGSSVLFLSLAALRVAYLQRPGSSLRFAFVVACCCRNATAGLCLQPSFPEKGGFPGKLMMLQPQGLSLPGHLPEHST